MKVSRQLPRLTLPARSTPAPTPAEPDRVELGGKTETAVHYGVSGGLLTGLTVGAAVLGAMATGPGALGAFMFAVPAGLIGGAVGAGINAWRGWSASKEAEPGVATRLETAFHYGVSGATLTGAAVGTAVLGALATGPGALGAFFFAVPAALIGGTAAGLANAWRGWRAGG